MRRKETLEELTEGLRELLAQRDLELETLRNEAEQLRKQREALIKAFDGGSVVLPRKLSILVSPNLSSGNGACSH